MEEPSWKPARRTATAGNMLWVENIFSGQSAVRETETDRGIRGEGIRRSYSRTLVIKLFKSVRPATETVGFTSIFHSDY